MIVSIGAVVALEWSKAIVGAAVMNQAEGVFDEVFGQVIELGNGAATENRDADVWDIADGILAGAIQYWLFSRQPCGDPRCEDCLAISTAEARMVELQKLIKMFTQESEYYHSPFDVNVGRA